MPDLLLAAEVLVGVLFGLVAVFLGAVFLRRRAIARGRLLTLCGLRRPPAPWRMGLVRYGSGQLEWYPLGGLTIRPKYRWRQRLLELTPPGPVADGTGLDALPDPVVVACRYQGERFELAVAEPAYRALRSWAEASPPGAASTVT